MATNQNELFAHDFMLGGRLLNKNFYKNVCQNTCNKTEIKANFHFSIICLWKPSVAIVTKVYSQQQVKQLFCRG